MSFQFLNKSSRLEGEVDPLLVHLLPFSVSGPRGNLIARFGPPGFGMIRKGFYGLSRVNLFSHFHFTFLSNPLKMDLSLPILEHLYLERP